MEMIMEPVQSTTAISVALTDPAAEAVKGLLEQRNLPGYSLRVYVAGGGCSGIQYGMAFDNNIRAEDTVTEINGIKILVDEVSIQYLQGATVDYIDSPQGAGFKITNPNALSSCECGSSCSDDSSGCQGCG
jgi:iron-sulfur cluster assembly accessory protein